MHLRLQSASSVKKKIKKKPNKTAYQCHLNFVTLNRKKTNKNKICHQMLYKSTFVVVKVVFSSVLALPWNALTVPVGDSERSSLDSKWCLNNPCSLNSRQKMCGPFYHQALRNFTLFKQVLLLKYFTIMWSPETGYWTYIPSLQTLTTDFCVKVMKWHTLSSVRHLKEDTMEIITESKGVMFMVQWRRGGCTCSILQISMETVQMLLVWLS